MGRLEAYDKALDYSYAPGLFPSMECLKNAKGRCMRLLLSSESEGSSGAQARGTGGGHPGGDGGQSAWPHLKKGELLCRDGV